MGRHALQRLYLAEDLVRRRRADEYRRQVASQRAARIDPNPHQIDAVIFALERIPDGGCIRADEVGLGKTIEAGLVIAQLMAEGAKRVMVVTPKALLGQWKQELYALFGIDAREVTRGAISCVRQQLRVAEAALGGGLSVEIRPKRPLTVRSTRDGAADPTATGSELVALTAKRSIALAIDDWLDVEITAGEEAARRMAAELRARWLREGESVLVEHGFASLDELRMARARSDAALRDIADALRDAENAE
ncbi:MAG TPA: SNF2-related protein, partial [Kofleriaceae bacterium]|nr:SNF2-related protein [Kofleriaceae bacterium]